MHVEALREFCLSFPGVTEDFPFDENVLVFRVGGKIFALCDLSDPTTVNLKCDPEKAIQLREQYGGIQPGYHMNKKHWNTVSLRGDVPDPVLGELARHSYGLVFSGLPRKTQAEIANG